MKLLITAGLFLIIPDCFAQGATASNLSVPTKPPVELRPADEAGLRFTLKQAEEYALANHPQIAAAHINADAVRQEIREARAEFFPQVNFESDSVYAPKETEMSALNGLNNSSVDSRQSDGFLASQLITDFGRTYELTERAHFHANAAADRANVAEAVVVLQVDQSYFDLLQAQAVLRVANETRQARQTVYDQISTMAQHQLRSILDVNFADVNLHEANLLFIQAQSNIASAEAELSTALGFSDAQHFVLTEQPLDRNISKSPDALIQQALVNRPELISLRNEEEAAEHFAKAQDAARYPKVNALGAAGINPVANQTELKSTYYAAGINVELPIFNGGNLDAQAEEAHLLARASGQDIIDAQNTISRDVRIAWLNAATQEKNLNVTAELVQVALQEQKLAQARYQLGTSSIVELIQAQLDYTKAELQDTSSRYGFQKGLAILKFTVGSGV